MSATKAILSSSWFIPITINVLVLINYILWAVKPPNQLFAILIIVCILVLTFCNQIRTHYTIFIFLIFSFFVSSGYILES